MLLCAGQVVFSSYYRLYRMAQAPAGGEGDRPGTGGGGGVCNLLPLYDFIPERMDIDDYQVNVGDRRRMGMHAVIRVAPASHACPCRHAHACMLACPFWHADMLACVHASGMPSQESLPKP